MFNAPIFISNIPDIKQIYLLNEQQGIELDEAIQRLNNNIFLNWMDEETCSRWEKILGLNRYDDDSLDDRRYRIKSKVLERLPYSIRVIIDKLDVLCPNGYSLQINDAKTEINIQITLKSSKALRDVSEFLDNVVPLNMIYAVTVMYNSHKVLSDHTHSELGLYTHAQLLDHVFD